MRRGTKTDLPAILSINRVGVPGVSAVSLAEAERLFGTASWFQVVELAGTVVGYAIAFTPDAPYGGEEFLWIKRSFDRFVYVDQVAVSLEGRRKGVASALYSDLEAFARAEGIPRLACEVNIRPENAPSLAFHTQHGFSEVGRLDTRDGRLVSLMVKELASRPCA